MVSRDQEHHIYMNLCFFYLARVLKFYHMKHATTIYETRNTLLTRIL
jgi:hypothetical protein